MPQYQDRSVMVDIPGIRKDMVNGGIARQVAPHPIVLKGSTESTKWYYQKDQNYLRYVQSFDQGAFKSDSASIGITLNTPGIQDGLHYDHYELEAIQGDIIPFDERQRAVSRRFMLAEDRIFFAGPDPELAVAGGTAGNLAATAKASAATINAAAAGIYACTTATNELNLTTALTMADTMSSWIAQVRTGLALDSLKELSAALVVTPDVKARLEGGLTANTDILFEDTMMRILLKAYGSAVILTTSMLGATLDYNNQKLAITAGSVNSLLMSIDGNSMAEVRTSALINRKKENEIDGVTVALEEKYVPIFKQPLANIYGSTTDITA